MNLIKKGMNLKISIYKGRLLVCHVEISQITTPVARLLERVESPQKVGVYQVGFIIFQPPTVEKLLQNDEIYIQKTFNQIFLFVFKKSSCFHTLFKQLAKIQKYFNLTSTLIVGLQSNVIKSPCG